ncbi:MAG: DUF421 domain-containing protein [Erysipelotrichaceae bacterium]|jgi:uncharacterized membrane protein YcaP (DUF421 family)|nr:DUF421 domain-containing protein [Erysipelotrichaceae bacterium]MCI9524145.1 DUF421 domain-containing protein [Erysipelotrichaceae bacterium]
MQEYFNLIYKCVIIYFVIILALRVMGKREVGELSIFDIVIYLVMSELLAISISEPNENIMKSLISITTLALLQIVVSWILLKSKKSRDLFDGKCAVLIHNGHINQNVMRKERYNIDDLLSQLHEKGIATPDEVEFAILESNGSLSVLEKSKCKVKHPGPLISDGMINQHVLQDLKLDEHWLKETLQKEGIEDIKDVFLCMIQKNGLYVIKKELHSKDQWFS